jgi:hypothetical protein
MSSGSGCLTLIPASICSGGQCINDTCICNVGWNDMVDLVSHSGRDCPNDEYTISRLWIINIICGFACCITGIYNMIRVFRDNRYDPSAIRPTNVVSPRAAAPPPAAAAAASALDSGGHTLTSGVGSKAMNTIDAVGAVASPIVDDPSARYMGSSSVPSPMSHKNKQQQQQMVSTPETPPHRSGSHATPPNNNNHKTELKTPIVSNAVGDPLSPSPPLAVDTTARTTTPPAIGIGSGSGGTPKAATAGVVPIHRPSKSSHHIKSEGTNSRHRHHSGGVGVISSSTSYSAWLRRTSHTLGFRLSGLLLIIGSGALATGSLRLQEPRQRVVGYDWGMTIAFTVSHSPNSYIIFKRGFTIVASQTHSLSSTRESLSRTIWLTS